MEPFELVGENLLPEYMQVLKDHARADPASRRSTCSAIQLPQGTWPPRNAIRSGCRESTASLLSRLEEYLEQAEQIRKLLVEANLRLVVSIAGKHTGTGPISSTWSARATSPHPGGGGIRLHHRFPLRRRASLNIAKEYAKVSGRSTELTPKRAASLAHFSAGPARDHRRRPGHRADPPELTQVIREELDEREQYVILHHFRPARLVDRKEPKDPQADRRRTRPDQRNGIRQNRAVRAAKAAPTPEPGSSSSC